MKRCLMVMLLAVPVAQAAPVSSVIVDRSSDDRVTVAGDVDVRELQTTSEVTLRLTVSSSAKVGHVAKVMLGIPPGAQVVGLTVNQGTAHATPFAAARAQFDAATRVMVKPALLELQRTTRAYDRLALSVSSVSREAGATATVTIRMPKFRQVVVNLAGQRLERTAATKIAADPVIAPAAVTARQSLYVDPSEATLSHDEVADYVRANHASLRWCFDILTRGAPVDAVLAFTISQAGRVADSEIGGALDDGAKRCVQNVLALWQFRTTDEAVAVNYPVHFPAR